MHINLGESWTMVSEICMRIDRQILMSQHMAHIVGSVYTLLIEGYLAKNLNNFAHSCNSFHCVIKTA